MTFIIWCGFLRSPCITLYSYLFSITMGEFIFHTIPLRTNPSIILKSMFFLSHQPQISHTTNVKSSIYFLSSVFINIIEFSVSLTVFIPLIVKYPVKTEKIFQYLPHNSSVGFLSLHALHSTEHLLIGCDSTNRS